MPEANLSDDGPSRKKRKHEGGEDSERKKRARKRKRPSMHRNDGAEQVTDPENVAQDGVDRAIPRQKRKRQRSKAKNREPEAAREDETSEVKPQPVAPTKMKIKDPPQPPKTELQLEEERQARYEAKRIKKAEKKAAKTAERAKWKAAEIAKRNAGETAKRNTNRTASRADVKPNLPKDKLANIQSWAEHSSSESTKAIAKKERKKSSKRDNSRASTSRWNLSLPIAGRWLDIDPIFVQDADGLEYIISGSEREVQLLSLETSLVVRTFSAPPGRSIQCFAAGKADESLVQIAFDDGSVRAWDWENDVKVGRLSTLSRPVIAMASFSAPQNEEASLLYISKGDGKYRIHSEEREQVLFETEHPLESLHGFGNAEYIVAHGPSCLVLGSKKNIGEQDLTDVVWTQVSLKSAATCVHARLLPVEPPTKKSTPQRPGLSIAIGHENGQIHLYDDISTLSRRDSKPQLPTPRILHWHRGAVSSVKFSQDGNYLISGGNETVLVLWQLQTAKKQFLPHLTSAIERIVVNPKGDRYALQMGDNSIMLLSTSELKPVANFAGLQMVGNVKQSATAPLGPAAALHPRYPNQLLLSVPSTRPKSEADSATRPFLQTFDLGTSRHISRQALTRNNVTDFNTGPEDTPITPPDVTQIAISHDGSWLATADEWMPPASDLEHFMSDNSDLDRIRQSHREAYLKFWRWDERESFWTLTTRADSPHTSGGSSLGSGQVLALASNPATSSFATIGEDFCVKIWKPKKRTRHGVVLTDRADTELMEWVCKQKIQLPQTQQRVDSPFSSSGSTKLPTACLSYAGDGSLLAASLSTDSTDEAPVVYFINPTTGESIPKSGFAATSISAMGFLDQYFIAASQPAAYVWDLINENLMYKLRLSSHKAADTHIQPALTIDTVGGTFVIAVTDAEKKTKVMVHKPKNAETQYEETFDLPVEAVLAGKGAKGYTLLFSDATVRTLSPGSSVLNRALRLDQPSLPATVGSQLSVAAPADESEDLMHGEEATEEDLKPAIEDEEDDRPVVRPEQLANIFDTPQSFALPPVREMFEAVVGLFGRQPYVKPAAKVA